MEKNAYDSGEMATDSSVNRGVVIDTLNDGLDQIPRKIFLNPLIMRRMIQRFLAEKKMHKEKLAKVLGITSKEMRQLFSEKESSKLAAQINLPLTQLYCRTRWNKKTGLLSDSRG